jgi:hypothetical protein
LKVTKVNEYTVVVGSNEWKSLPHAKRAEIQAKRLGGHKAKVYTPEEAKEAGIVFDDSEADTSHIPDPNNTGHDRGHKAVMRDLTAVEAKGLYGKEKENWEGRQPDQPVRDDTGPGDRSPREPGVIVTQVREYDGYRIERRNPFGHWVIPRLEELGTFVTLQAAEATLRSYLEKNNRSEAVPEAPQGSFAAASKASETPLE